MTTEGKQLKNSQLPTEWFKVTKSVQEKAKVVLAGPRKRIADFWDELPRLHRIIIMMLSVFILAIIFFPAKKSDNPDIVKKGVYSTMPEQPVPDFPSSKPSVKLVPEKTVPVAPSAEPVTPAVEIAATKPSAVVSSNVAPSTIVSAPAVSTTPANVISTDSVMPEVDPDTRWFRYEVMSGDTLANIFRSQKLPLVDLYAIAANEGADKPLSRIMPQQELRFRLNAAGELDSLEIRGQNNKVLFTRELNGNFVRKF